MHADGSSSLPERGAEKAGPDLLGGYRLLSELSSAGGCRVHRARAIGAAHASDVAIKTLGPVQSARAGRARLLQEARIGLNLRGPHLVRVLEVHADPVLFLVMEHVEGASLRALLAQSTERDVARYVIPVLVDVLDALFTLHNWRSEEGIPSFIVHQAPSLRHMLVGLDGVARLIDMSHARGPLLGGPIDADPTLRHSELAPEQVLAPATVDPRSDLFIVGLALWEALTGAPLSASPQVHSLTAGARDPEPLQLCKAGAHTESACFDEICQRALSPLRHDRYWSAAEMASALRKTARAAGLYAERAELSAWVRDTLAPRASQPSTAAISARPRLCVPPPPPPVARTSVSAGSFEQRPIPGRPASSYDSLLASLELPPSATPTEARDSAVEPGRITYQTAVTRLHRAAPRALMLTLLIGAVVAGLRLNDTRLASADAAPSRAAAPWAASLPPALTRPTVTQLLDVTVHDRPSTAAPTRQAEGERGTARHGTRPSRDADTRADGANKPDPFVPELPANPY